MITEETIRGTMMLLSLELAKELTGDGAPEPEDVFAVLRMPVAPAAILSDLCRMLGIGPFGFAEVALGEA